MFVDNLTPANAKSSIAATIIAMATSLKLNIVAEGIETVEQTHALQLIGCTIFQGFLYSKPTRIDLFDEQAISASK
jgi:sensor c-di-GMP phosphodiesterase-like protein